MNNRGETLHETLAAMLIVALTASVLVTSIVSSSKIMKQEVARRKILDAEYVESQNYLIFGSSNSIEKQLIIESQEGICDETTINLFKSSSGLFAFKK